jgi:galactose oxidase
VPILCNCLPAMPVSAWICATVRLLLPLLAAAAGATGQVAQMGSWAPVQTWPFIPVSIMHLPDGRLIGWSSTQPQGFPPGATFTHAGIYDPAAGTITPLNNIQHDMFCAGMAQSGDGRMVAAGGGADVRTTSIIGISSRWGASWSSAGDMLSGRWYNTAVTLPSGNIFTMWGRSGGTLS